jgi:hypothetical protein
MRPAHVAAIPSEKARLMQVAVWNRGGVVNSQVETMPPTLVDIKAMAMAVARR